jgi:hypothetical protein
VIAAGFDEFAWAPREFVEAGATGTRRIWNEGWKACGGSHRLRRTASVWSAYSQ